MYADKHELLEQAKELLKNEMTNISYTTWIKSLEIDETTEIARV